MADQLAVVSELFDKRFTKKLSTKEKKDNYCLVSSIVHTTLYVELKFPKFIRE